MPATVYEGDLPARFSVLNASPKIMGSNVRVWNFCTVIKNAAHEYTLQDGKGNKLIVTPYFFKTHLMDIVGRIRLLQRSSGDFQLIHTRSSNSLTVKVL